MVWKVQLVKSWLHELLFLGINQPVLPWTGAFFMTSLTSLAVLGVLLSLKHLLIECSTRFFALIVHWLVLDIILGHLLFNLEIIGPIQIILFESPIDVSNMKRVAQHSSSTKTKDGFSDLLLMLVLDNCLHVRLLDLLDLMAAGYAERLDRVRLHGSLLLRLNVKRPPTVEAMGSEGIVVLVVVAALDLDYRLVVILQRRFDILRIFTNLFAYLSIHKVLLHLIALLLNHVQQELFLKAQVIGCVLR